MAILQGSLKATDIDKVRISAGHDEPPAAKLSDGDGRKPNIGRTQSINRTPSIKKMPSCPGAGPPPGIGRTPSIKK